MAQVNVPAATFMALTRQANREGIATHRLVARLLADNVTDPGKPAPVDDEGLDVDDAGFPAAMTGRGSHQNAA